MCFSEKVASMGKYSIKELEKLSGIKAHTLRIWEKRYNVICPDRTETNIRTYSDSELKKLLNIAILNHHGLKISKIARLSEEELTRQVAQLSSKDNENLDIYIDQLSIAMVELDEMKFEKLLSNFILRFGFEKTILDIMFPFLQKIGILWLSGNITPIQEHFISNLIRQKIIVAVDAVTPTQDPKASKVILFLPEDELHEIGLLYYYYTVKSSNCKAYYLGQHVPLKDLEAISKNINPDYLVTTISHNPSTNSIEEFFTQLHEKFPNCSVLASGSPLREFEGKTPKNITLFQHPSTLKELLS